MAMTERRASTADLDAVQSAYAAWAPAYIDAFGSADKATMEDRSLITTWAKRLRGPVLDAGCGPGHWSAFLHGLGLHVEGVDATPEFIAHARRSYPEIPFRRGDLHHLDLAPGSLGGVLAWFSIIHADPTSVPELLRIFAESLRPGGSLLLGFFAGDELQPFDHRVVTAWAWPLPEMVSAVEGAGLTVTSRDHHPQPNGRIAAELVAHRPA